MTVQVTGAAGQFVNSSAATMVTGFNLTGLHSMKVLWFSILMTLLVACSTRDFASILSVKSGDEGPACEDGNIVQFQRPLYPDKVDSPTFPYKFRYVKGSNLNAPTVVFLPGGPGATSITERDVTLPSDLSVVWTDPRGVGCNNTDPVRHANSLEIFSTDYLALDVLEIISYLKLQKYILYGQS